MSEVTIDELREMIWDWCRSNDEPLQAEATKIFDALKKDAERYRKIKRMVGEDEKITVMRNAKGFSVSSIDIRDTVRRWQYDTLDQAIDEVVE